MKQNEHKSIASKLNGDIGLHLLTHPNFINDGK